jgi:hypothetical protein
MIIEFRIVTNSSNLYLQFYNYASKISAIIIINIFGAGNEKSLEKPVSDKLFRIEFQVCQIFAIVSDNLMEVSRREAKFSEIV